jgi:protein TonB
VNGPAAGRSSRLAAALVTVAFHGLLVVLAARLRPPRAPVRAPFVAVVLAPRPPPERRSAQQTAVATGAASRARPRAAAPPRAAAVVAPAPAAEGPLLALDEPPLDLTGDSFVVAAAGAGGSSAWGSGRPEGGPPQAAAPDQGSAVSLGEQSWSCPWPRAAEADRIDEQTVVIHVVVAADGTAESVEVLSDPGHGFAEAAAACALRTRFTPARDRAGRAVRAASPPIRVRFTR